MKDTEKHELLMKVPRCWCCGDELQANEAREYATCSVECFTLLMRSYNEAWCDRIGIEQLKDLVRDGKTPS